MAHAHLRKQDNCLNCGSKPIGRFCHNCGQENTEPQESVLHFVAHFINDITHFDGKFFETLKVLLFRPGFLPREYFMGKRARYLNPVRMYLFTSFVFFLVFFSLIHLNDLDIKQDPFKLNGKNMEQVKKMSGQEFDHFTAGLNQGKAMTRNELDQYADSIKMAGGIHFTNRSYRDLAQYDSLIKSGRVKDNWIQKKLVIKEIEFNKKFNYDEVGSVRVLIEALGHNFPQMLFVSLPFVALLLQLLYIRHKEFYYVSHGIFTLHFYIFVFIVMLITIGISKWENFAGWNWLRYVNGLLGLTVFFYLYKAMREFYQQGRKKTFLKYTLFLWSFLLLIIFIFIAFLFVSFFQI